MRLKKARRRPGRPSGAELGTQRPRCGRGGVPWHRSPCRRQCTLGTRKLSDGQTDPNKTKRCCQAQQCQRNPGRGASELGVVAPHRGAVGVSTAKRRVRIRTRVCGCRGRLGCEIRHQHSRVSGIGTRTLFWKLTDRALQTKCVRALCFQNRATLRQSPTAVHQHEPLVSSHGE